MEIRPNTKPPVVVSREEMMRQWELAGENRQLLQHRMGHPARAWVKTFGCQGNVADSEKIMGLLLDMGCEPAVSEQEADIILYNTCAVRENAEVRLMSMVGELRRLKQKNPTMIVGLCGCMMQQEEVVQQIRRSYPFVELIFGTHVLHTLPQMINRLLKGERRVVDCYEGEGRENPIAEGLPIQRSSVGENIIPSTDSTRPPASARAAAVCTAALTSCPRRPPKNWEIITVAPEDRPTKKPTIRLIRLPVAPPTAARASLPTYLPTMMASAVLYSCWKNVPSRMGKKKISSCFQMTPSMMLFPAAAWAGRRLLNIAFSCSFAYLPAHFIAYPARFVQGGSRGTGYA